MAFSNKILIMGLSFSEIILSSDYNAIWQQEGTITWSCWHITYITGQENLKLTYLNRGKA